LLEKLGYRADVAVNGRDACLRVEQKPYDLLLMDIQMPEMDGLEATRWIRGRPQMRQPWIVAMTANAFDQDREACFEAGMNGVVVKPVRIEELEAMLVQVPRHWGSDQRSASGMVLQTEVLERLAAIFDGQFTEILSHRLKELRGHLQGMGQALECGDLDRLHREVPLIKSKGGILGAERLSALCEAVRPDQSLVVQRELWQQLGQELGALEQEIETWIRGRAEKTG
ncbi:MAG TPA: response regulator, partial [Acidobacteriota bacterium]|nr:response regulator [Acidobacteriota bacterium]